MTTSTPAPQPGSKPDPRPGKNPGYDDANPTSADDAPRHQPDARGADFGKLPNPEAGGLQRPTGASADPATDTP
jgi:hypothetical protein